VGSGDDEKMNNRDRNEKNPSPGEENQETRNVEIAAPGGFKYRGPVSLLIGLFLLVLGLIVGFAIALLTFYGVIEQLSGIVDPAVSRAVIATMTSQPTPTTIPTPTKTRSPVVKVYDDKGKLIRRREKEYPVESGRTYNIKLDNNMQDQEYEWTILSCEGGDLIGEGSAIFLIVPQVERCLVKVCLLGVDNICDRAEEIPLIFVTLSSKD
jgi:hypothetical protein